VVWVRRIQPGGARRPELESALRDSGCFLGPIIVASMGGIGTATRARALQYTSAAERR
jgi:hypothetical protein